MLKKTFLLIITILVFVACQEETEEAKETKVPVKVYAAKLDTISQYLRLTGSVEAENDAVIYSKISEKIDEINFKVGDKVKENDIIAIQHNEALKQGVEMAKAAYKTAEAQNKLAKQEFERMKKLYDQKAVSTQQFDQVRTQMQTAESTLEQVSSQFAQAVENFQNSLIKAPFAGIVAAVNYDVDQMVPAGQPVAQVVNSNSMKAKLALSGSDANKVKLGQAVEIEFPSVPNKLYKGEVVRINEALNPITNSLEIEVRILNPDENVKSGIFGKFNLELVTRNGVIVIPEVAIQQQTEVQVNKQTGIQQSVKKYFVFKIENDHAVLTEVQEGIRTDGRLEITGGLNKNDKVVVVGQNIVKNGDLVNIIE